jgi:hypothetical protein
MRTLNLVILAVVMCALAGPFGQSRAVHAANCTYGCNSLTTGTPWRSGNGDASGPHYVYDQSSAENMFAPVVAGALKMDGNCNRWDCDTEAVCNKTIFGIVPFPDERTNATNLKNKQAVTRHKCEGS